MSNRRELQGTDSSWTSSLADALQQNLQLEDKLRRDENETPQARLQRMLSTRSVISTSSSFAERQQAAIGSRNPFREIGVGSIGKVFEQPGTPWAFKVLLIDRTEKLWNNYVMHLRIQQSFDKLGEIPGLVEIPRVAWFADKDSEFWPENLHLFPNETGFPRQAREVMCMERVFPLPQPVRNALIELFCNPINAPAAKNDPLNKDCLIRLFLGRKRVGTSRPGGSMFFSLRNYKLHADQIQELQLDADEYARNMADALAVLHWHTNIDTMDLEFVLGSSPFDQNAVRRQMRLPDIERLRPGTSTFEHTTNASLNFKKRIVSLWLIDFDACAPITMNAAGVQQAAKAFMENDPYYPRPFSNDTYMENLSRIFSQRYVETGKKITIGSSQGLPAQFVQEVVKRFSQRSQSSRSGDLQAAATSSASAGRGQQPSYQRGGPVGGQSRRGHGGQRGTTGGTGQSARGRTPTPQNRGTRDQGPTADEPASPRTPRGRGHGRR
ncbi:zinc finger protein [Aspergillus ibericus CBS 121593]|uniref:DUF3669 domain-containing protein n=1 Tax=Aspergillus ibericus CBS 121593 TaxID=1448316 RepID=A0A395GMR5_9EURO|nr:hypothetical protein BO80DRAFT_416017 [Aspergillus ibericus CBS 121593]RAK96769.1 hypothetical protein BO80DRAFT_416017 [Aspergillus ibericus CBS 121593]